MKLMIKVLVVAMGLVLSACQDLPQPKACSLIGCESGLTLTFEAAAPERFRFSLSASDGETRQGECPAINAQDAVCLGDRVLIPRFTPTQLDLSLSVGEQTSTQSFEPEYKNSRPNGPDCEPECKQATLRVKLPASTDAN